MNENKCPYCHQYKDDDKDDGYLYEDDISAITKNLYGKAQQVKWTTYFPINCCPICGRDFNDTKNA